MNWEEQLREKLDSAKRKDGWGYDIVEADYDGLVGMLESFIKSLLKKQRGEIEKEYNVGEHYEPFFGWCDVEGCEDEGCCGGTVWRKTGYWTACIKHAQEHRDGKPQPKMKQSAIDRENSRDPETGYLTVK